ncbi:MAG: tail fiber domain-containing protein [Marinicellaceae bacterium]
MKKYLLILITLFANATVHSITLGEYFTYQGELYEANQPVNGNYDLSVNLYETENGGNSLGGDLSLNTAIVNGLFTFEIDIGSIPFMGDEIWLQLSIKPAGSGTYTDLPRQKITNSPYAIHAQFVGSSGVNSDAIQTGSVTGIKIADNTITQSKIQDNSVGTLKIINASITEAKLADSAVTTAKLADNSVTSNKISTGAVTAVKVAADSIVSGNIVDGTIINSDIAQSTITTVELATDSVTHFDIRSSAVRTEEIQDGTIVAADINSASVQQRVTGVCSAGSSIRSILENGTVTCETDDAGTIGWGLAGNAGTTPGSNFIGTTDNKALEFKVNNQKEFQIAPFIDGSLKSSNITFGFNNSIDGINIKGANSILGGTANVIGSGSHSSLAGGNSNVINGNFSSIIGGRSNSVNESFSVILGGEENSVGGVYSFAAGYKAEVRHSGLTGDNDGDENTFIWSQTGVTSTGPNQVLFQANGGFGIGTNAPASPIHIKGQGETFGVLTDEVVMTLEPKETTDDVSIVINKLDGGKESALAFAINKVPEFDIRTVSGGALDFNSYQAGTPQFMMRINNSGINRIDFNTNLEPQTDNVFDIGSSSFRFAAMHATNINSTNPVNVTSDKRLKDNINELNYGLSEILSLKPVSYRLKNGGNDKKHLGLIAQEVEILIPEIVNKANDENQTRSMRYAELVPVLIRATQEQQSLIDQQHQQILALEQTVKSLLNNQTKK